MSRNYVRVTPSSIKSAASSISNKISSFERDCRQLQTLVASSPKWQGKDAEAFAAQFKGFEDDLEKMIALLKAYQELLEYSAAHYIDKQNYLYEMGRQL